VNKATRGARRRARCPRLRSRRSVEAKGNSTWKLKLKKGTYKYVCDPHASFMKGSFTVS
jgi:plastocyanin